jgi:hypothetical protein
MQGNGDICPVAFVVGALRFSLISVGNAVAAIIFAHKSIC